MWASLYPDVVRQIQSRSDHDSFTPCINVLFFFIQITRSDTDVILISGGNVFYRVSKHLYSWIFYTTLLRWFGVIIISLAMLASVFPTCISQVKDKSPVHWGEEGSNGSVRQSIFGKGRCVTTWDNTQYTSSNFTILSFSLLPFLSALGNFSGEIKLDEGKEADEWLKALV